MGILHLVFTLILLVPVSCTFELRRLSQGPSVEDDAVSQIHRQRENVCQQVPHRILRQVLGSAYNEYYMSFEAPEGFIPRSDRPTEKENLYKRSDNRDNGTVVNRPFFVKEDLEVVLSEEPAWKVDFSEDHVSHNHPVYEGSVPMVPNSGGSRYEERTGRHRRNAETGKSREPKTRRRRSAPDKVLDAIGLSGDLHFRWHCEAPLRWMDLGPDYFPRYILSVDCNHSGCRGSRFRCEPRSFAIKVLRRREGVCAPGYNVHRDTLQIGSDQMPHSLRQLWVWEMRAISFCCVCQYK